MSRYGVYPGNTSASTSTTGETISESDEDSKELKGDGDGKAKQEPEPQRSESLPDGTNQQCPDPTTSTGESTARQSTTATPVLELPAGPLDPLSLASVLSFHSGEALTPLERFVFNALIEHYCSQRVSSYLSGNLPHHVHEAYRRQLYQRVTSSFGMSGGFDRDEFRGVRESVLEGLSAIVNTEMVNIIQEASLQQGPITPAVEYTPREPDFDWLAVESLEGNEVVMKGARRANRPKSSDNLAPITFVQANPRMATGLERPATSDGRKIGGMPGISRHREGSHLRSGRRPDLVRAMSFDHLNQAVNGPKTPTFAPPVLTRSATSYTPGYRTTGYQTPQPRTSTPHGQSHQFRFGPAPPLSTKERNAPTIPSMHHRAPSGRIPPHISNMPAIRASVSLQQQTAQAVPMERSWSVDRTLSLFHPQPQHPAELSSDQLEQFITSKTSRYKTDFIELAFLGKGGFASVYKVRNSLDGREYAIKKVPIRAKHLNDKDKLDLIFKEIKTLAKLEHGNIVRYYSAWVESANGLWERPGKKAWSAAAPEARSKAESPRMVSQVITKNMNLSHGTTPDRAKTKRGPVLTEIPVLSGAAFIDDGELEDPLRVNFSNTADDDTMGIQFGDDTTKDSNSTRSPATIVVTVQAADSDSSDTVSTPGEDEDGDVSSDIEVIPRFAFPSIATQIPLPLSPQCSVEYLPHRRTSFVSDVDKDGNEIQYVEPFPSESGLVEGPSAQLLPDRARELREFKELSKKEGGGDNSVFDDEDTDDTGGEESCDTTSVSIRTSNRKAGKGNLDNKQLALLRAARMAKKEAERKEILTLMIMMSVHPLTLKEFLRYEGSESTQDSAKYQFSLPHGLAIQMEQNNHDSSKQKERYCWHLKCALKLFRGVLDGAEYLHNKGIVHRDLKPGNIFLNIEVHDQDVNGAKDKRLDCRYCDKRCGVVPRIGDFGLVAELVDGVRRKNGQAGEGEAGDGDILRGNVVGTALYRPPPSTDEDEEDAGSSSDEYQFQFANTLPDGPGVAAHHSRRRKNIICEKTDIYALGIIFFELLYRCDTGSERVKCIMDVREGRKLPEDWKERVCKEGGVKEVGAEALGRCVMGMTTGRRAHRWDLGRVRAELRMLDAWE
ncbi:hypothetical protein BGX38DRAFT_891551 [Terfezia claveryi]|nr:hypothetical protein BGX38DRAFT_891551 [Terfezia claveryi]